MSRLDRNWVTKYYFEMTIEATLPPVKKQGRDTAHWQKKFKEILEI
jgi:hypothetical protein